ncbi:glycosyltransferase [Desulfohalovibrio reitneri]|uniref:glycosyltransferase n=1 Tax=Desulfohalovibrio reitneri TaxID=1307759 RepID=UPI0004A75C35|nr:glycosyltransferase [Desulfohalovibrio reitneri]
MRQPLTVCDVVQTYSPISGGVKSYVNDKRAFVAGREDLRQILVIPGEKSSRHTEERTTTYHIASPRLPGSKSYRLLINKAAVDRIVARDKPDVIEVSDAYQPAWFALWAGGNLDIPVVGFYHSDYPRSYGRDLERGLGSDTLGGVVTDAIEGYLASLYNKMAATITSTKLFESRLRDMGVERVVRVPLGCDTDVFRPLDSRAKVLDRLGLPLGTYLLLFVGRFAPMKNISALLAMMEEFGEGERPVHLVLTGDGEDAEVVRRAAESRDDITWIPYASDREELVEVYSAADLFCNPGTHETFGLVSVEAQSCGTRVLGVKDGGMGETLEGEESLIEADAPEAKALADAVRRIRALGEGEESRRLRRERMKRRFSLQRNFRRLFRLYDHVRRRESVERFPTPEQDESLPEV